MKLITWPCGRPTRTPPSTHVWHQLLNQCAGSRGIQQAVTEAPSDQPGGLPSQHIQEDLQLAKARVKEGVTAIFVELAEELMEEDCAPFTDLFVVASIGNYAGYLVKNVQSKGFVSSCCKKEFYDEGAVTIEHPGPEASAKFAAVHSGWSNVPIAHIASFEMMVWDRLMCYEKNRDRSVKFLSLTMQYADTFGYLIRVLA